MNSLPGATVGACVAQVIVGKTGTSANCAIASVATSVERTNSK